jgi:hypothetical protein
MFKLQAGARLSDRRTRGTRLPAHVAPPTAPPRTHQKRRNRGPPDRRPAAEETFRRISAATAVWRHRCRRTGRVRCHSPLRCGRARRARPPGIGGVRGARRGDDARWPSHRRDPRHAQFASALIKGYPPPGRKAPGLSHGGGAASPLTAPAIGLLGLLLAKYEPEAPIPQTFGEAYDMLTKHGDGLFGDRD